MRNALKVVLEVVAIVVFLCKNLYAQEIQLHKGWNFIGFNYRFEETANVDVHQYGIRHVTAFGYLPDPFNPEHYILSPLSVTSFQPGQGYWVEVEKLNKFILRGLRISGEEANVRGDYLTVDVTSTEFSNNKTLELSVYPPYVDDCREFDNVTVTLNVSDELSPRAASIKLSGVKVKICRDSTTKKIEIQNVEVPVGATFYVNGTDSNGLQINPVVLVNNSPDSVLNDAISRCDGESNCFSYNLQAVENKLESELGSSNPLHQISYPGNYTFTLHFEEIPLDDIRGNIYVSRH